MAKTFRRVWLTLTAAVMALTLAGCGGSSASDADIALLVQGNLDQLYRGEVSADYEELTGVTSRQAAEICEASMAAETAYFCDYFRINSPSQQTTDQITALLKQICSGTTYQTGPVSREGEDSCAVQVELHPSAVLTRAVEALPDRLADFYAKYPPDADGDQARYEADWAEAVIGAVRSQLSGAPSGEPVTATVHVDRNGDGAWAVRGEDLQAVNRAMLLYP